MTIDLDRLEALAAAATAGPWEHIPKGDHSDWWCITSDSEPIAADALIADGDGWEMEVINLTEADKDFIAAAREAVPELVRRVRELELERGQCSECCAVDAAREKQGGE